MGGHQWWRCGRHPGSPGKDRGDPQLRLTRGLLVPIPTSVQDSQWGALTFSSVARRFLLLKKHVLYAISKGVAGCS